MGRWICMYHTVPHARPSLADRRVFRIQPVTQFLATTTTFQHRASSEASYVPLEPGLLLLCCFYPIGNLILLVRLSLVLRNGSLVLPLSCV
ncbi:hypothetical protein F9C07_13398 [Aspergillus flavus]|uniref:Cluster 41 protein AFLA_114800 n=2 Tax=Aspergillus flavus (strain ATCC 200026 / FGSC A1120 / IAM 13836 / NRRL 3357 / JCM 12722 / SRRC 167) TaxID=332952 RepID=FLUB_ASPFN|nr:RecName: Full=Cluster 41 protein AFLA_114800 [Aspergillus flavus NRRL3357]QRD92107.1 hypothetical protein F9C07_13398 [Aspergillus flavus]